MKTVALSTTYFSPLGPIELVADEDFLVSATFQDRHDAPRRGRATDKLATTGAPPPNRIFDETRAWLDAYFAGRELPALPPMRPPGTSFERDVWDALGKIPAGETVSYGEVASAIRAPSATRAVGRACGANPIPLLIPCHRVIGASGALTGFSAGMHRKTWLLAHEERPTS